MNFYSLKFNPILFTSQYPQCPKKPNPVGFDLNPVNLDVNPVNLDVNPVFDFKET